MNDDLDTLDDAKLSEVFAVEVAGWKPEHFDFEYDGSVKACCIYHQEDGSTIGSDRAPNFATDANAVLPYLCLYPWHAGMHHPTAKVKVSAYAGTLRFGGDSAHFSRSACIALIRAKRASK